MDNLPCYGQFRKKQKCIITVRVESYFCEASLISLSTIPTVRLGELSMRFVVLDYECFFASEFRVKVDARKFSEDFMYLVSWFSKT